jgi:2-polyprenyl-6-methoxyphenol hydroxylase-like FAD-dependent oxidoreductase
MRAHHTDVVVVGARAAGAATAMSLARADLDVTVVERTHLGSDTLSTHALRRGAVIHLHRWGCSTPQGGRHPGREAHHLHLAAGETVFRPRHSLGRPGASFLRP